MKTQGKYLSKGIWVESVRFAMPCFVYVYILSSLSVDLYLICILPSFLCVCVSLSISLSSICLLFITFCIPPFVSGYWHTITAKRLALVCTWMGERSGMSIYADSPSNETLNRGPLALLLRRQYEFRFGIDIVQFSFFFFQFFKPFQLFRYLSPSVCFPLPPPPFLYLSSRYVDITLVILHINYRFTLTIFTMLKSWWKTMKIKRS